MYKINPNINHLYLSYKIGKEVFALSSDVVRNIIDFNMCKEGQKRNNAERKIRINNQEIHVVDLRVLMGSMNIENTVFTSIIVLEIDYGNSQYVGVIVDEVLSLIDLDFSKIESPVEINKVYIADFIEGFLKSDGQIIKIINISNLLAYDYKIKISHLKNEERMVLGC